MVVLWVLAGAVWGLLAMLTLHWTVDHLQPQAPSRALMLLGGGLLLRLLLAGGVLLAAVRQSILAAGLALAGMLLARSVLLVLFTRRRWASSAPVVRLG
jgi:hypothetical protein